MTKPVVLFSHGPLKETDNPYLHELVAGVGAEAEVRFLSPITALTARPDVVHVHWPKHLVRGATRWRSAIKFVTSAVLVGRLRLRRTPVVQTMHNLGDHDGESRAERWLFARLEKLISARIYLNESAENDYREGVVVLHGTYRDELERTAGLRYPLSSAERDLLLFGLLRPYKGIESLIEASAEAGAGLTLAGRPVPEEYGDQIADQLGTDPSRELRIGHLSDADLVDLIARHRVVALPYRAMYNSGALLYALSVGRPVLTPRTAATESLEAEFGQEWLRLYTPPLSADAVRTALAEQPAAEADLPSMARRSWAEGAALHLAIYRTVRAGSPASNRARLEQVPAIAAHSARNHPGTR